MAVYKTKSKITGKIKWGVSLTLPNGNRFRRIVGSKKQAEEAEKKIQNDIVQGKWGILEKEKIGFVELAEKYLEYARVNRSAKTCRLYEYRLKGRLVPYFRDIKIGDIDKRMIDEYKEKRLIAIGASAINTELHILSAMFRMAVRWDLLERNPMSNVEKMKIIRNNPRYLNQDEIEALVESAKGFYIDALITTALHTGMRKSELFNLTWNDVDFEQGSITIQSKDDWHTKNYKPRTLQMTDVLYQTLKEHRHFQRELGEAGSGYVFTYQGKKLRDNIKFTLARVVQNAGLKGVTLHTLRHTFANQLAMAGVSLMEIKELMGYQSYETTLRYAHLAEGHVGKQTARLPYGRNRSEIHIITEDKEKAKSA